MADSASPPRIFDRALLHTRLSRALARNAPDFLMARAADDLHDRLMMVKRDFPHSLDLGTPTAHFANAIAATGRPAPLRAGQIGSDIFGADETLPVPPGSYDLIVSGMALQWVNDLPGVLTQVRRALAPDGLFLACLPGGASLVELRAALAQAEEEITGGAHPRVSPFVDVRDMGALLQRAGFTLPVSDADSFVLRYGSALALMQDLRAMGAANVLVQRARKPLRRDILARATQIYARRFSDPDGRVRASFELVWISGWAPHESQQKPAKPGSATMRLKDAIKGTRRS